MYVLYLLAGKGWLFDTFCNFPWILQQLPKRAPRITQEQPSPLPPAFSMAKSPHPCANLASPTWRFGSWASKTTLKKYSFKMLQILKAKLMPQRCCMPLYACMLHLFWAKLKQIHFYSLCMYFRPGCDAFVWAFVHDARESAVSKGSFQGKNPWKQMILWFESMSAEF